MKATELMIGDWVQNTNGDKGRVIGFDYHTNIKENEIVIAYSENSTCWTCSVEPIPLTAQILEKNGFKFTEVSSEYQDIALDYDKLNGIFYLKLLHTSRRIRINYVHILQHALRLCGLTELADNFTF